MKSNVIAIVLGACLAWIEAAAVAADKTVGPSLKPTLTLEPTAFDAKNKESTLGVQFKIEGNLYGKKLRARDAGLTDDIDTDAPVGGGLTVSYQVGGTITADKQRNPKNFIDAAIDASYLYGVPWGTMSGGAFVKYEGDQSGDSKQGVYGVRGTFGKKGLLQKNDAIALDAHLGRVDPSDDPARQAALGGVKPSGYYRWDLEFLYMYRILNLKPLDTFEFNYRYFRENGAPAAIESAGLDRHKLATYRIGMGNGLFLAYSTGKLPFDRQNDKIFEIGFSYKLAP